MSSRSETPGVFGASYASVYDALYLEKNYVMECDVFESAAGVKGQACRLLDVGCGTGGHSIELTHRGHDVTGVDMSSEMIKIAQSKAAKQCPAGKQPRFLCGKAADFKVEGQSFDAAMMMFAVLGYMRSNTDVIDALRNINRHLKPDGKFMCDFWWGPAVLTQRPGERVRIVDGAAGKTVRATHTVLETSVNLAHVHFDILQAEAAGVLNQSSETHTMRYFFGPELHLLFEQAGFEIMQLSQFPDFSSKPDDASWNAMIVARKTNGTD
jgi:SAM-dependent methyltransferase